jgi:hypothetical protein
MPPSPLLKIHFFIISWDMFFASLILALSLLSAYLILWKPRKPRKRE